MDFGANCADFGRKKLTIWQKMQIYLLEQLGFPVPSYVHIPLLLDGQGRRLAKRDKDLDLSALARRFSPQEILGMLAFAVGLLDENRPATLEELTRCFAWKKVKRQDVRLPYET